VIASSDYDMDHAEEKIITGVTNNGLTVTLNTPFKYLHYSEDEIYGNQTFPMRVEVGLLTRNVVVKGSENSLKE